MRFEITDRGESEHPGQQVARKHFDIGVELLRGIVEFAPFDGNPVFRPFELRLQIQEVLVGFQVGITLGIAINRLSADESSPCA